MGTFPLNQQCERGEEMLARKRTTTGVYRTCCTVPADPAMLQTQTDEVLKIMFQQSLRGHMTCKEMRSSPTELEGSPDLQRDEGVFPTELEGSWPDLQRDEEVFQQSLSRWKDLNFLY